jgi:hypothetical protein
MTDGIPVRVLETRSFQDIAMSYGISVRVLEIMIIGFALL